MRLSFLPLLRIQRDLYALPRGGERFREYIKTMTDAETGDLALPLVAMNPMGKDHIPALLDEYIALGAEDVAQQAIDVWRATASAVAARSETAFRKRGFLTGLLWTSEPASAANVRDAVLTAIHRAEYLETHAAPKTLGEMLDQEGYAMARAGCTTPSLAGDDLAYTRTVIAPHLGAHDRATVIACLFGDVGANALGYPPQGLTDRAGLALALHEAQQHLVP